MGIRTCECNCGCENFVMTPPATATNEQLKKYYDRCHKCRVMNIHRERKK